MIGETKPTMKELREHLDFIQSIRNIHPTAIKGELRTEFPMDAPKVETKLEQSIEVYDPRKVIDGNKKITKILIQRAIKRIPVEKPETLFYIVPMKVLEIIKEYSFEEWDSGLETKI